VLDAIERKLLILSRGAAALGVLFLLLVAALSVADIVTREVTGRPIRGAHDLSGLLIIIIIAACFPAGLLERRQIEVTLIRNVIPAWANRVMRTVAATLTGFMFVCIAWFVTVHAGRIAASQEYTMVLNWPLGPWWWAAAVCFWACVPAQLFVILAEATGRPADALEH
jgi:TRAP-type C4-dicarboxylate transport system permease small subunit